MKLKHYLTTALFALFLMTIPFTVRASQIHTNSSHSKQIYNAVKAKLNLTDKELQDAAVKGKTAFDLAREKGISEEDLRNYVAEEAEKSIDSIVSKGYMPKFAGEKIKNKATSKIKTWDGSL